MRKILFMLTILSVLLVSCGDDNNKESNSNESRSYLVFESYLENINPTMEKFITDTSEFANLVNEGLENQMMLSDDYWLSDIDRNIQAIQSDIESIKSFPSAPDEAKLFRYSLMSAVDQFEFITQNFQTSITTNDVTLFKECLDAYKEGTKRLSLADSHLNTAYDKLKE